MKKILFVILFFQIAFSINAQIVKGEEPFTEIMSVENKIVFLKEFPLHQVQADSAFNNIKQWAKDYYGKDRLNSTIRFDSKNKEIRIVSRVELILPENSDGVSLSVQMKYKTNVFLFQGKCVMETRSMSYFIAEGKKTKNYRAEDIYLLNTATDLPQEFKENLKKSTLYFINEISENLSKSIK